METAGVVILLVLAVAGVVWYRSRDKTSARRGGTSNDDPPTQVK